MIKDNNGELVIVSKKESEEISVTKKEEAQEKVQEGISVAPVSSNSDTIEKEDEFSIPNEEHDYEEENVTLDEVNEETKSPSEDIIVVSLASDANSVPSECPIDKVNKCIEEAGLSDALTDDEEALVDGFIDRTKVAEHTSKPAPERVFINKKEEEVASNTTEQDVKLDAVSMLNKFKDYITSNKFDKQVETAAKKHGVDQKVVKNKVVGGFLGTVANILGLTLVIGADVIMSAVNFVAYVTNKIVEFTIDSLMKVINLATLNCGVE